MTGRLAYLRERLNTSLWPIPLALCIAALSLAGLMLWLDRSLSLAYPADELFALSEAAARDILGIIAGSIIGVGGVAFSITMVALTLTSGQYGPKVLRSFLGDHSSKLTLGLFLGTYLYSLVTFSGLALVEAPRLTVFAALCLALAALAGFVHFIHRTATDLQADQIVHRIGRQLCDTLIEFAQDTDPETRPGTTIIWRRSVRGLASWEVASPLRGYVQTIDYAGMRDWCREQDVYLLVRVRAGDFLVEGIRIFTLYAEDAEQAEQLLKQVSRWVVVGPMRTPVQDAEYAISQLNQLAARALSPGINDPGTAITCIDWCSLALAEIVDRDLPGCIYRDGDGKPRLLARIPDFPGLVKAIHAPLRQLSGSDIAVSVRLLESLCDLAQLTQRQDRIDTLRRHGMLIMQGVNTDELQDFDVADIRRRHRRLLRLTTAAA